ncbi:MAG: helix-turn-helix domain-containing protein [Tannerellaceae bacterium]
MVNLQGINYTDLYCIKEACRVCYQDDLVIAEVEAKDLSVADIFPVRMSFFSLFLVEAGSVVVEADYGVHTASRHSLLILLPEHLVRGVRFSHDFKGRLLLVDQAFFSAIEKNNQRLYQPVFLNIRNAPVLELNETEYQRIVACNALLKEKIGLSHHHFKDALVRTVFTACMLEVDHVLMERDYNRSDRCLSRQDQLVSLFFKVLRAHWSVEHKVTFYADKLCVTPQHLAFTLKQLTGKTTSEWIAGTLLVEAQIMLRHSSQTVQEISDALHFCDASAFGKFFKVQTGITPAQYRKKG